MFFDISWILQTNQMIQNVETGQCLDINGNDGSGDIYTADCNREPDQLFYWRDRGSVFAGLYLKNVDSDLCISGGWYGRDGNLKMKSCDRVTDSDYWVLWGNGEITSKYSRWCWDIDGYDGVGQVGMWPCQDLKDQMWTLTNVSGNV